MYKIMVFIFIPDKLKRNACIYSSRGSYGKAFLECGRILTVSVLKYGMAVAAQQTLP